MLGFNNEEEPDFEAKPLFSGVFSKRNTRRCMFGLNLTIIMLVKISDYETN